MTSGQSWVYFISAHAGLIKAGVSQTVLTSEQDDLGGGISEDSTLLLATLRGKSTNLDKDHRMCLAHQESRRMRMKVFSSQLGSRNQSDSCSTA